MDETKIYGISILEMMTAAIQRERFFRIFILGNFYFKEDETMGIASFKEDMKMDKIKIYGHLRDCYLIVTEDKFILCDTKEHAIDLIVARNHENRSLNGIYRVYENGAIEAMKVRIVNDWRLDLVPKGSDEKHD